MKIIGQTQHDTFIVEMSEEEWESIRDGTPVMPAISDREFLYWANSFKPELRKLKLSPYLQEKLDDAIDRLWHFRDRPDGSYWDPVLADGNRLRSFREWAVFMTTMPNFILGYGFWRMRSKAYEELIAALECYLRAKEIE